MMTNTNPKILSCEIEQNGKKYKLVDVGNDNCDECAFCSNVKCPIIRDECLCVLVDSMTKVWKEDK